MTAMRKLIKDFRDYQFVYYWYEKGTGRISPLLPTLNHAEEWYAQQQRINYTGPERRGSRKDNPLMNRRRSTDQQLNVDIDISIQKISDLKQSFAA